MILNYREHLYEESEDCDRIEFLTDQGWSEEHAKKMVREFRGPTHVEILWTVDVDNDYEHTLVSARVDDEHYLVP